MFLLFQNKFFCFYYFKITFFVYFCFKINFFCLFLFQNQFFLFIFVSKSIFLFSFVSKSIFLFIFVSKSIFLFIFVSKLIFYCFKFSLLSFQQRDAKLLFVSSTNKALPSTLTFPISISNPFFFSVFWTYLYIFETIFTFVCLLEASNPSIYNLINIFYSPDGLSVLSDAPLQGMLVQNGATSHSQNTFPLTSTLLGVVGCGCGCGCGSDKPYLNTINNNTTPTTPPKQQHPHNTPTTPPQQPHNTPTTPPQHPHNTPTTPPQP